MFSAVKRILASDRLYRSPNRRLYRGEFQAFTMLDARRLDSIIELTSDVFGRGLSGDCVECGTCRGGSAAIIARQVKLDGWKRHVWLYDTFEGHPDAGADTAAPDHELRKEWAGCFVASPTEVIRACRLLDAHDPDHITITKGIIEETLPQCDITQGAFAHLDVDWYGPTRFALEHLLPRMQAGSYIQVDDYGRYDFCRQAVDEVLAGHGDRLELDRTVSGAGVLRVP